MTPGMMTLERSHCLLRMVPLVYPGTYAVRVAPTRAGPLRFGVPLVTRAAASHHAQSDRDTLSTADEDALWTVRSAATREGWSSPPNSRGNATELFPSNHLKDGMGPCWCKSIPELFRRAPATLPTPVLNRPMAGPTVARSPNCSGPSPIK